MFNAAVYDLATRLKRARRSRDLTQGDIARALGFGVGLVSQIERGLIPHRVATLLDFGRLVGLDVEGIKADLVAAGIAGADLKPAFDVEREQDEHSRNIAVGAS